LREAHVVNGHLTRRAWEAKLSENAAKSQKNRCLKGEPRGYSIFLTAPKKIV
jgi:hypothetical protein